jgi:hypothetical protein
MIALAPQSLAWSNKEHIQLARLAAERLIADPSTPPAMKAWLQDAVPSLLDEAAERDYFLHARVGPIVRGVDGILYWATMPDMVAMGEGDKPRNIEPFGLPESRLHYLDVEYFMKDPSQRTYAPDLSHKPALQDFPRDLKDDRYKQAGMLPFRVQDCYDRLVRALADGRLNDKPGQYPRDEHAARWAGYLAHYAADNTQPHHATADYKSQSYFPGQKHLPNAHNEMEYRMCDDDLDDFMSLRQEYWPALIHALNEADDPAAATADPWQATLQVLLTSYDALPLIGRAAVAAAKRDGDQSTGALDTETFFHFRGQYLGRDMTVLEMKARQQAWAVRRIQHLWRQAWDEAHRPSKAVPASRAAGP